MFFFSKAPVDWFFMLFFLQKSLASIGWLLLLFLFIFFDQVGGWSSCSFSKALVVRVDCLQKIYFALHGLSFKDVVVIFFAQVGGWLGCRWLLGTCVVTLVTLGSPCHTPPSCITLMIIATILHQSFLCIDKQN